MTGDGKGQRCGASVLAFLLLFAQLVAVPHHLLSEHHAEGGVRHDHELARRQLGHAHAHHATHALLQAHTHAGEPMASAGEQASALLTTQADTACSSLEAHSEGKPHRHAPDHQHPSNVHTLLARCGDAPPTAPPLVAVLLFCVSSADLDTSVRIVAALVVHGEPLPCGATPRPATPSRAPPAAC